MIDKSYKGAVFFDIDGTLLDEKCNIYTPTETTKNAIKKLRENGYLTGIATGRAKCYMDDVAIDTDCYITCNGSVAEFNNDVFFNDYISREKITEFVKFLEANKFGYSIETRDRCYYGVSTEYIMQEMLSVFNINPEAFSPYNPSDDIRANKVMAVFEKEEQYKLLCEKYGDKFLIIRHRSYDSADVGKFGITKASGVEATIKKFNIPYENTYAFGDGANDAFMLDKVKHGIAMTPHAPELIPVAEYFTGSVADEGIYHALKHYGLI